MQDNHRSKYYPKDFNEDTYIDEDSNYPIYRRRNNGRTFHHKTKQYTFNNCHVVPYNPYLTQRSLGPTSFKDLRSYEDITYDSFQEAANAQRLLADDKEWDKCLEEATFSCLPAQIQHLFSTILLFAVPTDPMVLLGYE